MPQYYLIRLFFYHPCSCISAGQQTEARSLAGGEWVHDAGCHPCSSSSSCLVLSHLQHLRSWSW